MQEIFRFFLLIIFTFICNYHYNLRRFAFMKTISMHEFHSRVKQLAVKKGKTVSVAKCEISEYSSGIQITFQCYVDGYLFYDGKTPEQALAKLREAMFPVKRKVPKVTIEI